MAGWRRTAVCGYAVGVHAALGLAVGRPDLVERGWRLAYHDPAVAASYQGMVSAQALVSKTLPDGATVFVGDSRVRDLDVAAATDAPAVNFGIGGDTARGLLSRVPGYARLDRAGCVVVAVGVNDLAHFPDDEYLANMGRVLAALAAGGGRRAVVCGILPVRDGQYSQPNATLVTGQRVSNPRIREVNRRLAELCAGRPGVRFVDSAAVMADPGGSLRAEYTSDGLHFTPAGGGAWAADLRAALAADRRADAP